MGAEPSRTRASGPGRTFTDWTGRVWTCAHTDALRDPTSTICLAGHCSYCGFRVHEPRNFPRVRTRRVDRLRSALLDRDGPWCFYCSRPFGPELPSTLDHVVPRSRGGPNAIGNLVLACGPCNNRKADRVDIPRQAFTGLYPVAG